MQKGPVAGLLVFVLIAGFGGVLGGPQVVEDECVQVVDGVVGCDVVVENPEENAMTVNVTVEVKGGETVLDSDSEIVEIGPGEREEVSLALGGAGDIGYAVDVTEVDD